MNAPFFSIVIPSYNRSALLPSTLSSIWNQAFTDFEVIVVNDGSTDNTSEILSAIEEKEPRLRVINQENSERGRARNNGWKEAKGNFVVFFDSDDLMHPDYLEEMHKVILTNNPEIVCGKVVFQTDQGNVKSHIDQKNLKGHYNFELFLKGNPIACHFAVKNAYNEFKPFNEDREQASMEDWIFLLENTLERKLFIIDKPLVTMRMHSEQSMKQDETIAHRKLKALALIDAQLNLSRNDRNTLKGYAFENVGIHFVNSKQFKKALSMFWKSLMIKGPSRKMAYNLLRIGLLFMKNDSK